MKQIILSLFIAMVLSHGAQAAGAFHKGDVARIYLTASGSLLLKLKNIASGTCTAAHNNHYYSLAPTHAAFEATYSLLLTAANTGAQIALRIDNSFCTNNTISNTPISYVIQDF